MLGVLVVLEGCAINCDVGDDLDERKPGGREADDQSRSADMAPPPPPCREDRPSARAIGSLFPLAAPGNDQTASST